MINDFPDLDVNDVIYGIEILDEQGFIEETLENKKTFFGKIQNQILVILVDI